MDFGYEPDNSDSCFKQMSNTVISDCGVWGLEHAYGAVFQYQNNTFATYRRRRVTVLLHHWRMRSDSYDSSYAQLFIRLVGAIEQRGNLSPPSIVNSPGDEMSDDPGDAGANPVSATNL